MQRVFFAKTGEPVEVLQFTETAPEPTPKTGEVLVRLTARPINPSDLLFIRGQYGIKPDLPAWPGFEGAGEVEAVGPEVTRIAVGTRVALATQGTWQDKVVLPAKAVIPVPESLPDTEACQLYVNPFTAWALLENAGLAAGDYLLLSAGASAFAQQVTQLAAARGLHVISTVRRDDHRAHLEGLGARAVINTEKEPLASSVKELTKGKGANAAFEAVGGTLTQQLLESLAPGSTLWAYGLLSLQASPINLGTLIFHNLAIKGFWLSEWLQNAGPELRGRAMDEILGALQTGALSLPVEAEYDLAEVHNAVLHAELAGRIGKVVLVS